MIINEVGEELEEGTKGRRKRRRFCYTQTKLHKECGGGHRQEGAFSSSLRTLLGLNRLKLLKRPAQARIILFGTKAYVISLSRAGGLEVRIVPGNEWRFSSK